MVIRFCLEPLGGLEPSAQMMLQPDMLDSKSCSLSRYLRELLDAHMQIGICIASDELGNETADNLTSVMNGLALLYDDLNSIYMEQQDFIRMWKEKQEELESEA